ncbi:MAG: filamentous hemagglutinin N-terminal domain-containing protein [Sphingomonas sp.]|nr:filamentous hemagglutinin N-terminal domain-containing protein [Sphingomonas sp.]
MLALLSFMGASAARADDSLPSGGIVRAGEVTIGTPRDGSLTINQTSRRAIVDWNTFNIGSLNGVTIRQSDASAAILNRVTSGTTTTIAGNLTANGTVYLINPNGIQITSTGTVAVGRGFVASTLDISNSDFLAGKYVFAGRGAGGVVNGGRITAGSGGSVVLIGGSVTNTGLISVPAGRIGIGAGERVTLDMTGDGFLQVALPNADAAAGDNKNTGALVMAPGTRDQIIRDLVNLPAQVDLNQISGTNGAITIGAEGPGKIQLGGTLTASGGTITAVGQQLTVDNAAISTASDVALGGKIVLTAHDKVDIANSSIDASGVTGGGTIRIGGGRYGADAGVVNARSTTVSADTTIRADATGSGNGGDIVLWSDARTQFAGTISARALGATGDGGEVEVSGRAQLVYDGMTDLRSAGGRTGNLLLDPYDVTISSGADSGAGFTANANDTVINTTTLANALGTANVTVSTGSAGTQAGNITVANSVSWASGNQLTLNAANNITVNAALSTTGGGGIQLTAGNAVTLNSALSVGAGGGSGVVVQANDSIIGNTGASITTQGQAVTLNSDRDASGAGAISLTGTTITSNGGNIVLGGGANPLTTAAFTTGQAGVFLNSAALNSGGGLISIRGTGGSGNPYGILSQGTTALSSGAGQVTVVGTGGTAANDAFGIYWTAGTITTTTGGITLTGTGGGTGAGAVNRGIDFRGTATSTSGNIALTGTSSAGIDHSQGIFLANATLSTAGNIDITGASSAVATGNNAGIFFQPATITGTGSGNITITATSLAGNDALQMYGGTVGGGSFTGALTLNANSLTLANTLSGSGALFIQPTTASTSIGVGTSASGTLNLDATELANLTNGFSSITIGSATGNGAVEVRNAAFQDPVTIRSPGSAGTITVRNGTLSTGSGTSAGSITLQAGDWINGNNSGGITTQGQAITLNADRDANQSGYIIWTGNAITSNGGDVIVGGGLDPLSTPAYGTSGNHGVQANGSFISSGAGNISIRGAGGTSANRYGVNLNNSGAITSTSGNITIVGTGSTAATGNNAGIVFYNTANNGTVGTSTGAISLTGIGYASGAGVEFNANVNLRADNAAGSISVTGTNGASGPGGIYFRDQFGTVLNFIGNATSAAPITLTADTMNISRTQIRGTGTLTIQPLTPGATIGIGDSASGLLNLDASELATIQSGFSSITFGRADGTGAIDFRPYAFLSNATIRSGTGDITVTGDAYDYTTRTLTLASAGNLLVQPLTASTTIGIGDSASGTLNLTAAEIAGFQNGFSSITIGSATGTGAVDIRNASFLDPVTIRTPSGSGTITLNGALATGSGTSAGSITLQAGDSIIGNTGASVTTQGQAITFNADRDESGAGAISLTSTNITSNGSDITLGGGANPLTGAASTVGLTTSAVSAGAGTIRVRAAAPSGSNGYSQGTGSALTTTTGDILVTGSGDNGLFLAGGSISSTSGNISLSGTGAAATGVLAAGTTISTGGSGNLTLTGTGGSGNGFNYGVIVYNSAIASVADGLLTVNGTAGTGGTISAGIGLTDNGRIRATGNGSIALTGVANGGNSRYGLFMIRAAQIEAAGSGNISITTSGGGAGAEGIYVSSGGNATPNLIGEGSLPGTFSGTLTLRSDKIALDTLTLAGTGGLEITPFSDSTTIGLGDGASGTLNLTAAELATIQNGFSSITIGSATGTGAVDIRNASFLDPVTIRTPSGSGTITLNGALATGSGTSAGSITLQAGDSIIGNSGASVTTQGQAITLNSDRDASGAGAISLTSTTITSNGGDIVLGGGANPLVGHARGTAGLPNGVSVNGGSISTFGGTLSLTGTGNATASNSIGVSISSAALSSGAGTLALTGNGGGGHWGWGVSVANSTVRSTSGTILLTGTTPNANQDNQTAIVVAQNSLVESATGNVTLTGTANSTLDSRNRGVFVASSTVRAVGGDLTINAYSADVGTSHSLSLGEGGAGVLQAGGALTINANSISAFNSSVITGSGTLTIQPTTPTTTIGLGNGASGTLNLDATELGYLQNGFSSITIGSASGSGAVDIRNASFLDPVTIRTPSGSGTITLNGALATGSGTSAGSITLQAGNSIIGNFGASITTQGQAITLNSDRDASGAGAIALIGTAVTSNGGDITFGGGANPLTTGAFGTSANSLGIYSAFGLITSAGGAISLRGTGGTGVSNAGGVLLESPISSGTGPITITGTGGTGNSAHGIETLSTISTTTGAITLTGFAGIGSVQQAEGLKLSQAVSSTSGAITFNANRVQLLISGNISSAGALSIQPTTASATIGIGDGASGTLNLDATELGFLQNGFSSITIGSATGSGAVDIRNASFLDPVTIRSLSGAIGVNGALSTGSGTSGGAITLTTGGALTGGGRALRSRRRTRRLT